MVNKPVNHVNTNGKRLEVRLKLIRQPNLQVPLGGRFTLKKNRIEKVVEMDFDEPYVLKTIEECDLSNRPNYKKLVEHLK